MITILTRSDDQSFHTPPFRTIPRLSKPAFSMLSEGFSLQLSLAMTNLCLENGGNSMVVSPEEKIQHARTLCEHGLWDEVLVYAKQWQVECPEDHKAFFYAGLGFTGLGQYRQAEAAYRQALKIDDTDPKVWNNLGGILFEHLRRPQDGIHCIEETLKLNPDNKLGWANLAAMVGRLGQQEKAITCADRAIALDPHLIEAYLYKAAAARALGKTEILREVCEILAAIEPENFRRAR
jgi:tetratricopeptide (TPR) repeat protein